MSHFTDEIENLTFDLADAHKDLAEAVAILDHNSAADARKIIKDTKADLKAMQAILDTRVSVIERNSL